MKVTTFKLLKATFIVFTSFIGSNANAFHGESIIIYPNQSVEVVIAVDPEDASSRGYVSSPYGFMRDVISVLSANASTLAGYPSSTTVFLDFERNGDLLYTVSREVDGVWAADDQVAYRRPADSAFIFDVLCVQILGIECEDASNEQVLAFDQSPLTDGPRQPFISVGTFPLTSASKLNVFVDDTSLDQAIVFRDQVDDLADLPNDAKLAGSAREVIDFYVQKSLTSPNSREIETEIDQEPSDKHIPFEQDSQLDERIDISPGFDPRLRYITVHCTGPGVMSASQIQNYASQVRRNKGHGYIMLDGSYISVASIAENPNVTYATKTEACLRSEAFGTMFNIELNYNCHWKPSKTDSPSEDMLDRLADVINWSHQNIGPLGIIAHTYVDMGLVDGHTDPQGNPGFDWQNLYERIENRGGNLNGITLIDPEFASEWPISRTDRAHQFPPIVTGSLPTGRDECRRHASH